MKFSDSIIREDDEIVYIRKGEYEFEKLPVYGTAAWRVESYNVDKPTPQGGPVHLYRIPVSFVIPGMSIYDENGNFVAYRSE